MKLRLGRSNDARCPWIVSWSTGSRTFKTELEARSYMRWLKDKSKDVFSYWDHYDPEP